MSDLFRRLSFVFAVSLFLSAGVSAQVQPVVGIVPSFTSVEAHEYDTINLATLGIRLNVPVRSKAGHIPFSFELIGGSQVNKITTAQGTQFTVSWVGLPGLAGHEPHFGGASVSPTTTTATKCDYANGYGGWVYTDPSGRVHPTGIIQTHYLYASGTCESSPVGTYTTDGSGIYVYIDIVNPINDYAIDADGNKIIFNNAASSITEPSGNSISSTKTINGSTATSVYTDTLNETALTQTVNTSAPGSETDTFTDALGTTNNGSIALTKTSQTILTTFGCSWTSTAVVASFPSSVTLPDGSTVTYGWEKNYSNSSDYTGRVASIKLPTGGTISYAYSGGTNGINCSDGSPNTIKRTTPDGTWTYTHPDPMDGPYTTTVTDPKGNNVVYNFVAATIPLLGFSPPDLLETEKQVYTGAVSAGNLVQTVFTCYNNTSSSPTSCNATSLSLPITEKDVYTTYPGVTGYAAVKTAYDSYGRVTDVKAYDFNAANPTNEKVITYGTGSPTSQTCTAIGNYILNKPCTITLKDSQNGNATLSQTWNSYDTAGNLLQTWNLVSGSGASGTYVSKSYTYTNGVVQTTTESLLVNGTITTGGGMNYTTTSCNDMFVTSQYPTGFTNLKTSQVWDCNGGVTTSQTDANSQVTKSDFYVNTTTDPFYRPLETVDQLNNVTSLTYTATSTDASFPVNGSSSIIETHSTLDSTGRVYISQLRQGPSSSTWDTKSRSFDGDGRQYSTTITCATTVGAACTTSPTDSQTYDGLNRPLVHTGTGGDIVTKSYPANDVLTILTPAPTGENAKSVQKEYDGLGRLTSACLISSATGSGSCGQTTSATGFLTKYVYDAAGRLLKTIENDQIGSTATQTRTYTYDFLGRVTSESNPESSTTTKYTYDTVTGTCSSTSIGDLVQKVDPNTNSSCYTYDTIHRNTSITYSGPNSTGVNKYFTYDAATVDSIAMANAEGRMAEAYTCSGSCTSKITDEGFSYDARGQMSNYYQSSPNSGGYYHLAATRWQDGQIETVAGVGLPTITYSGLDGEARVSTVSATGINPVTGVNYYNSGTAEPIGALLTTTLGTGDTQNFTYDPNTSRMTRYSATVGATPVTISGSLTWNKNGTIQQNNISDAYNSANTQDCTYLYDDFVRASSVNCLNGSTKIWNQTFTYDGFGNLTKNSTGPGQIWNPGYYAASNHYSLTNVTYDNDGNLTYDSFHNYTWLADGHVATIDNSTVTYDALGNKVEEDVGGVIHEYVSGFGVAAQMTGQTQGATLVNLPGGVQALYSGGTLQRFRFPDWQATIRAESSPTSRAFTESLAFAPFGERYALKGAPFNVDSFTGSPDQIVPDEYDFTAREESNPQGRWVSPDPMRGTGNKYVYANNNPLSYVDPYGLYTIDIDGIESSTNIEELTEGENELTESHPWKDAQTPAQPKTDTSNSQDSGSNTANNQQKDQASNASQKGQPEQTAQNGATNVSTVKKGAGEIAAGGFAIGLAIAAAPETGGGSLAGLGVALALLGGEAEAGKGMLDVANGLGAVDQQHAEEGKTGVELANNPVSATALAFTDQKTAARLGSVASGAMGIHDMATRPEGIADGISKVFAAKDVREGYQSAKELIHQVGSSLVDKLFSLQQFF